VAWRIVGDPEDARPGDYDGLIWVWELELPHTARRECVWVKLSGTAAATAEEALPPRVAEARRTRGESEIGRILGWKQPPRALELHSRSHEPLVSGGDSGDAPRRKLVLDPEIGNISRRLMALGYWLGISQTTGASTAVATVRRHEDPLDAPNEVFLGDGPLDAARRAEEYCQEVVAAEQRPPDRPPETAERLVSHGYQILWHEPLSEREPIWMVFVYDDRGRLIDAGLGDDRTDALLGVGERLLPPGS
jgi:hypothetical protein